MNPNQENIVPTPDKSAAPSPTEKKSKSGILIIIFAILAIGGIGLGIYGLFLKPEKSCSCPDCIAEKPEVPEEKPEESKEEPGSAEKPKQIEPIIPTFTIDFDNVANNKHEDYYNSYSSTAIGTSITVLDDQNSSKNENYNYITCSTDLCKVFSKDGEETATIDNFQGKIREFYYIMFGQGYGEEKLYFIMDDGSVEYIPVHEAFNKNNIKSYGKVEGLTKIIKIHQVAVTSYDYDGNNLGSGADALAEDIDGNFYDLHYLEPFSETSL